MYDFIGDIHGHADKLVLLLNKLGYIKTNEVYNHPQRKAIFVGDYIDRGPEIPRTLEIVKSMVDGGHAIALMGNHEYNAICFHYEKKMGGHLRKHSIKNILQHFETIRQFKNMQEEYDTYIEWFFTLPLFYETDTFRAVHACWDEEHIKYLKTKLVNGRINPDLINEASEENPIFYKAVNETLKGKEIKMGEGVSFIDKDGNTRNEIRIKWWQNPETSTYKSYSVIHLEQLPDIPIKSPSNKFYSHEEKPVFFGHYWLNGNPSLYRHNVCCLDYSVAKDGVLAAYSLDDEMELTEIKFSSV